MWYALTSSKPLAAALTAALLANATVVGAGLTLQPLPMESRPVVLHPPKPAAMQIQVHLIPARSVRKFPAAPSVFDQPVSLPMRYRMSERGALSYIAQQLRVSLVFSGPNYALLGEHLPYGKPTPALRLLTRIANISYIQGHFVMESSGRIVVQNDPLVG
ncbi:hypothetical protein MQE22_08435 [Acidithiobacillus sp. YTS05]|nr:hypothetical protein MQE22_08435 [Acidithiobacillus sp. YTS05]